MSAPIGNKFAVGNNGGRPPLVSLQELPNLGERMVVWFMEKFNLLKQGIEDGKKNVVVDMPFFSDFAREVVGGNEDTLLNYCGLSKEFFGAYADCKEIQKKFIIFCGLNGLSHPSFAIFTAVNLTNMTDKKELGLKSRISEEELIEANEALKDL